MAAFLYVYIIFSSTNKCDFEHVTLALFKQTRLMLDNESGVPLTIFLKGGFHMKIVYPICCGIDVHKNFVVAVIATSDANNITTYNRKRFSTFSSGLRDLAQWLATHHCSDVCLESTGKYWIPVFNLLEKTCHVVLDHPKYVKAIRGKKNDNKDAKWIADLFKHDLVLPSFIPPHDIRQLRDLTRYRAKLTYMQTAEKNRLQNSLTVSNIQLASVVSDVFGASSRKLIDLLLEETELSHELLEQTIHGSLKKKIPDLLLALDGHISDQQLLKMKVILHHFDAIINSRNLLDDIIISLAEPFDTQLKLLATIPCFKSDLTCITVLSEIGIDMHQFPSHKHLCSWAGLTPQNNESAGKKKSVRISKAGAFLKPLLVQCALAAIKSKEHPEFRQKYDAIKKRRGHKKALIAVARMILTACYFVLKDNTPYQPFSASSEAKQTTHATSTFISIDDAIAFAYNNGFQVIDDNGCVIT